MSIESGAFPMVPEGIGETAVGATEAGIALMPDTVVRLGVLAILAWIGWRLGKGFIKNRKHGGAQS